MVRGVAMAELLRHLLAKKETILKLSLGVVLGVAGTASDLFAQSPAQYGGNVQQASYGRGRDCYPQYYQDCEPAPYSADNLNGGEGGEGEGAAAAPVAPFGDEDLYASNDTMANSPASIAPNMIGDLYSNGLFYTDAYGGTTNVPIAGGDRRFKIAENNNPLPMDRVFFNYHNFNNAVQGFGDELYDVNRYTFGIEKTFWDGMASFEVRAPFASGLSADQVSVTGGTSAQGVEFGNMTGVLKVLMFQNDTTILSAGLAVTVPTARDAVVSDGAGTQLARVDNEAVFLQPFVGLSWMDYDGYFFTFFGQADFDVAGDGVTGQFGATEQWYNQTLLMADLAFGKWLYRNPYADGIINGVAPVVELHYTTTTNDADDVILPGQVFYNPYNRADILNIMGGVHFLIGERTMLTVTGGAPLRTDEGDRFYDSEIGIRLNHYY